MTSATLEVDGVRFVVRVLAPIAYDIALERYLHSFPGYVAPCHAHLSRGFVDETTLVSGERVDRINVVDFAAKSERLMAHELGHVLGMVHTPWHVTTTMNPTGLLRWSDPEGLIAKWRAAQANAVATGRPSGRSVGA